jgi:predicted phosphohydrolase
VLKSEVVVRIAVTADLHWGPHPRGDTATRQLLSFLQSNPPDVFVIAGDVGAGSEFEACLALFRDLPCRKALVPGNHDIWVTPTDSRGDSLEVYQNVLPRACEATGFHYLDGGPLYLHDAGLALAGTINWYDYSWSIDALRQQLPDYEERLRSKVFSRGRHNDSRFVRWPLDDLRFTADVVTKLERDLSDAVKQAERVIAVTHHPPFYGLGFPRVGPLTTDALLWDAFCGNRTIEALFQSYADRIPIVFCGHTHYARDNVFHAIHGYNVGGDYHFKRLLLLDWPAGTIEAHIFGNPDPSTSTAV